MQTLSEQGCTVATSTDILAAIHSARVLCLLFSPELFILSICVTFSLHNGTAEMGEWMLPFHSPTDSMCALQLPGVFPAFLHSLIQPSLCQAGTSFLLRGWVKPTSSKLRDNRQSHLYLKIKPLDLFQELHSNSDCLSNLYCRLKFVLQPPKYKCPLQDGWNPMTHTESETSWRLW